MWTVGKKRKTHQNSPQVGHLHEEHHDMVNLAISVGDVMCAVNLDTEWLTVLNEMTNLMWWVLKSKSEKDRQTDFPTEI